MSRLKDLGILDFPIVDNVLFHTECPIDKINETGNSSLEWTDELARKRHPHDNAPPLPWQSPLWAPSAPPAPEGAILF